MLTHIDFEHAVLINVTRGKTVRVHANVSVVKLKAIFNSVYDPSILSNERLIVAPLFIVYARNDLLVANVI
ncbi:hypothetical protein EBT16_12260 [bacterium]|nr:hypothetical protein [bacterium]